MKKLIIAFMLTSLATVTTAQYTSQQNTSRGKNVISVNLLGDVSIVSLNYERLFEVNSSILISSKVGVGFNEETQFCLFGPCSTPPDRFVTFTHHITGNFGQGKALFEIGIGGTLFSGDSRNDYLSYPGPGKKYLIYPVVGLRLHPLKNQGFSLRLYGYFPKGLSNWDIFDGYVPIGISLGGTF
jgi:hypothetical protein